jgi:hypothetical protein
MFLFLNEIGGIPSLLKNIFYVKGATVAEQATS